MTISLFPYLAPGHVECIALYTSASYRLDTDSFVECSAALASLAKEILKAKGNNIHINLTAERGFGTPVYFEAKLRQEVSRTASVLNEFMHQVDLLIKEKRGVKTRIRCFSFEASHIYAKS